MGNRQRVQTKCTLHTRRTYAAGAAGGVLVVAAAFVCIMRNHHEPKNVICEPFKVDRVVCIQYVSSQCRRQDLAIPGLDFVVASIKDKMHHSSEGDLLIDALLEAEEGTSVASSTYYDMVLHAKSWELAMNSTFASSLIIGGDGWDQMHLVRALSSLPQVNRTGNMLMLLHGVDFHLRKPLVSASSLVHRSVGLLELQPNTEFGGIPAGALFSWAESTKFESPMPRLAYVVGPMAARSLLDQAFPWRAGLRPMEFAILRLLGLEQYRWMPKGEVLIPSEPMRLLPPPVVNHVAPLSHSEMSVHLPESLPRTRYSASLTFLAGSDMHPGYASNLLAATRQHFRASARSLAEQVEVDLLWEHGRAEGGLKAAQLDGITALQTFLDFRQRDGHGALFAASNASLWASTVPRAIAVHAMCLAIVWQRGGGCFAGGSRPLDGVINRSRFLLAARQNAAHGEAEWQLAVGLERGSGGVVPWFVSGARQGQATSRTLTEILSIGSVLDVDARADALLMRQQEQGGGLGFGQGQSRLFAGRSTWMGLPSSVDPRSLLALRDVYDAAAEAVEQQCAGAASRGNGLATGGLRCGIMFLGPAASDPLPVFARPTLASLHRVASALEQNPDAGPEVGCEMRLDALAAVDRFFAMPPAAQVDDSGVQVQPAFGSLAVVAPPPGWMGLRVPAVPRTLHFVWVGSQSMPAQQAAALRGWLIAHPDFEARLWTGTDILKENFPSLGKQIDLASRPEQIADLMRYEIVMRHGGFYVDLDFEVCRPIGAFARLSGSVVCHEDGDEGLWQSLSNGFFGFSRGHPSIRRAVSLAAKAVIGHDSPNWSTGPRLLRRALGDDGLDAASVLPRKSMYPVRFKDGEKLKKLQCAHHGEGGGCCRHFPEAFAVHWWSRTPAGDAVSPSTSPLAPVPLDQLQEEIGRHNSRAITAFQHASAQDEALAQLEFGGRAIRQMGGGACDRGLSTSQVRDHKQ